MRLRKSLTFTKPVYVIIIGDIDNSWIVSTSEIEREGGLQCLTERVMNGCLRHISKSLFDIFICLCTCLDEGGIWKTLLFAPSKNLFWRNLNIDTIAFGSNNHKRKTTSEKGICLEKEFTFPHIKVLKAASSCHIEY